LRAVVVALAAVGLFASVAAGTTSLPALNPNGIGPLKLGMKRQAALATGWLAHRGTGCTLGGKPFPITYRFTGPKAPHGVSGTAQFDNGKLADMSFTAGVATATGVTIGKTSVKQMLADYRNAGYTASSNFLSMFGGTFVTVKKKGKTVIQGFAPHKTITMLAVPFILVCD
jgi:hypothetical protein